MSDKPMLFSTPMVQAILAGHKTMTRRIIKPQPEYGPLSYFYAGSRRYVGKWGYPSDHTNGKNALWTPPCHGDDLLWVRETWMKMPYGYVYRADEEEPEGWDPDDWWYPSVHMPKTAARIFLRVSKVSVERVQDITDDDAELEGCECEWFDFSDDPCYPKMEVTKTPRMVFAELWDSLCKPKEKHLYGWEANPWVWRIAFQRVEKPENWPDKGGG